MSWEQFSRQGQASAQAVHIGHELAKISGFNDVRLEQGVIVATGQGLEFRRAAAKLGVRARELAPGPAPAHAGAAAAKTIGSNALVATGHSLTGTVVSVDEGMVSEAQRQELEKALPGISVKRSSRPKPRLTVSGGQGIHSVDDGGKTADCLTSFALRDPQDRPSVLTAGHCTLDGRATSITVAENTLPGSRPKATLGTVRFSQFGGPNNTPTDPDFPDGGTDLAVINTAAGITTSGTVPASANGLGRITGQTSPVLGTNVCRYSAATGWACGAIAETSTTYISPVGTNDPRGVTGFVVTNLSAQAGDSGSPVVAGTLAVGILTASGTVSGSNIIYAVPTDALSQYLPNSHLQLWVPEPTADNTFPAGPSHVTAAWQPGQTIHGSLPTQPGENGANRTITVRLDAQPLTTTTTDASGAYAFTLPNTMAPAPARHTVTITASTSTDSSTPLNVHLPHPVTAGHAEAWLRNGGPTGTLGLPLDAPRCGLKDNGCFQGFDHGMIYTATGIRPVAIQDPFIPKWAEKGWEAGSLGYPVADKVCGLDKGGCYQNFQNGAIIWSPQTQAHDSQGPIRNKWGETGWETGVLGYPTTDVTCGLRDGGCYQNFEAGGILWKPSVGAHTTRGAIRDKYAETDFERGFLGYPTSDEICQLRDGGCFQNFEGGGILWSPTTGAHSMGGSIRDKYVSMNSENSHLGYPTTDEICGLRDNGCRQDFQHGSILWSTPTGAHPIGGAINEKYTTLTRENGILGYPTSDETCGLKNNGCFQNFQYDNAAIYWVSYRGAHYIRGQIRAHWGSHGYENNPNLDYPSTDENCGLKSNGCYQQFGTAPDVSYPRAIYYTPTTGAHEVIYAGVLEQWAAAGWENGRYGYPTNEPGTGTTGLYIQQFQGGWITTNKP